MVTEPERYRSALMRVRDHLRACGDTGWAVKLTDWIFELDGLLVQCSVRGPLVAHAVRSKVATQGSDSLADLYLCEPAGHKVPESELIEVNESHLRFVDELYEAANAVIARYS